jgi:hypothetical protein
MAMVKIKFIGTLSRVIAGKRMYNGDTQEINEKLVDGLRGDPDVVIVGEEQRVEVSDESTESKESEILKLEPPAQPVKPVRKSKAHQAVVKQPASPEKKKRSKK